MKTHKLLSDFHSLRTMAIALLTFFAPVLGMGQNTTNTGTLTSSLGNLNCYFGYSAGNASVAGTTQNDAFGAYSLRFNTTGVSNVAFGYATMNNLTSGSYNVAMGHNAMAQTTTSTLNVAIGQEALLVNTTGGANTAVGGKSLHSITTATDNSAVGFQALYANTGSYNSALGSQALGANTSGTSNAALGYYALAANTTGQSNTAMGDHADGTGTTGTNNSAFGWHALYGVTTGSSNVGVGSDAGLSIATGSGNTMVGTEAGYGLQYGSYNTYVGLNSGPPLGTNITNSGTFGAGCVVGASNTIRIGNQDIVSIGGQVGWSTLSDGRFKSNIKEDVSGLEFISQLRPVSYQFDKAAYDKFYNVVKKQDGENLTVDKTTHAGFIAQEVEAIVAKGNYKFSGVVSPQNEKDHYSIRYGDFVVPLVKAVQELSKKVTAQQATIDILTAKLVDNSDKSITSGAAIVLQQNFPNPFTSETEIKMTLPDAVHQATVIIYDLQGQQLKAVAITDRGDVSVKIQGGELKAGMYLYALIADNTVIDTKRMILVK